MVKINWCQRTGTGTGTVTRKKIKLRKKERNERKRGEMGKMILAFLSR
jgi:hypothetical protein